MYRCWFLHASTHLLNHRKIDFTVHGWYMHKMLKIVIGKKKWKQSIRDRHIKLNSQPHLFYTQHKRHESWGNVENKKFTCNLAGKLRKFKIGICHNGLPLELFSELTNSAAITPLYNRWGTKCIMYNPTRGIALSMFEWVWLS